MKDNKKVLLKTLVGSHAHGLASPESDYDYRGVYIVPSTEILSIGYNYKGSHWLEGEEDNTSYELGHFLHLALKCNPSILEVFKAPRQDNLELGRLVEFQYGTELLRLFKHVWNPKGVYDAFTGYGLNQRKKMLDNHLDRWNKYAMAYLRTLWNLNTLLETGDFSLKVENEEFKNLLLKIKNKELSIGVIIDNANKMQEWAEVRLKRHQDGTASFKQEANPEKVNEFLLKARRSFWA